jgi:hypothetical protein
MRRVRRTFSVSSRATRTCTGGSSSDGRGCPTSPESDSEDSWTRSPAGGAGSGRAGIRSLRDGDARRAFPAGGAAGGRGCLRDGPPRRPKPPRVSAGAAGKAGDVQRELVIKPEASYIVAVKNPEAPTPPGVGLPEEQEAEFPERTQEQFHGRRSMPAGPQLLDHEGAELILIGADEDVLASSASSYTPNARSWRPPRSSTTSRFRGRRSRRSRSRRGGGSRAR